MKTLQKILSRIGIFFLWLLILPFLLVMDVLFFVAFPFGALASLILDDEDVF